MRKSYLSHKEKVHGEKRIKKSRNGPKALRFLRPKKHKGRQLKILGHKGVYVCDYCGFSKPSRQKMHNHMRFMHTLDHVKYFCDFCPDKFFFDKYELRIHVEQHFKFKEFSCTKCRYTTKRKAVLDVHIRTHDRERCPICKKLVNNVKTHIKGVHRSSVDCKICGKTLQTKTCLKVHMNAFHIMSQKCSICKDQKLYSKSDLRR